LWSNFSFLRNLDVIKKGWSRSLCKSGPRMVISVGRFRRTCSCLLVALAAMPMACRPTSSVPSTISCCLLKPARSGLRLRGGRELKAPEDTGESSEGPEGDSLPTVELGQFADVQDAEGDEELMKELIKAGPPAHARDDELDTGNGDMPLEGDLVSICITVRSGGVVRATTETLLHLADVEAASNRRTDAGGGNKRERHAACSLTPEEAGKLPLQEQYGYGGQLRVAHVIEARAMPGTFSFRLGSQPDNIVHGVEEAILGMRRGEVARIRVSGSKGFDEAGFHGIAREWGIAPGAVAEIEIELRHINTIDASGDGCVLVTYPHASALELVRLRTTGEWRKLERRPSARAHVRLRCTLRAVERVNPVTGNTTNLVFPLPGAANAGVLPPGSDQQRPAPEFASWVQFGNGQLPWGLELAAARSAVAGVGCFVRLAGAGYLDSSSGEGAAGREECGTEAMTYNVVLEDWDEERSLTSDGGLVLVQRNVGAAYDALSRPIMDGDQVLIDLHGRVVRGPRSVGGEEKGVDRNGGEDWSPWPLEWVGVGTQEAVGGDTSPEGGRVSAGGTERLEVRSRNLQLGGIVRKAGWDIRVAGAACEQEQVEALVGAATSLSAAADVSWDQGDLWPRKRRVLTVGNFETASGLERALLGLRVGQSAQVRVRPPYLNVFRESSGGRGESCHGGTFGPEGSEGLELSFTVLALRPAMSCSVKARLALAGDCPCPGRTCERPLALFHSLTGVVVCRALADGPPHLHSLTPGRRRMLGNALFVQGKYEDALAVYRLGADLLFHWRASTYGDGDGQGAGGGGEVVPLSPYDKQRLAEATAHMTEEAKDKYVRAMHAKLQRRDRARGGDRGGERERGGMRVAESATGEGEWGRGGGESDAGLIREAIGLRGVCLLNAAQCLLKLGRAAEAKGECDQVLGEDGENARALQRRCVAHLALDQVAQAHGDLQALVRLKQSRAQHGNGREAGQGRGGRQAAVSDVSDAVSDVEVERLVARVKRAQGKQYSADRELYAKMLSAKSPKDVREKAGRGGRGRGQTGQGCQEREDAKGVEGGAGGQERKVEESERGEERKVVVQRALVAGEGSRSGGPVVLVEAADSPREQARKKEEVVGE
jgi:tetratricopeptide (TPR) repeat protein